MKKIALALTVMLSYSLAQAHGLRFEGDAKSNAGIITEALLAAVDTDSTIVLTEGYYGEVVLRVDSYGAIRCAKALSDYSCTIVNNHDRPLDPIEMYPLGDQLDQTGDSASNAALISQVLVDLYGSDDKVEVVKSESSGNGIRRTSDDVKITCTKKGDVKCDFQQ